jgi:hypothetical protein
MTLDKAFDDLLKHWEDQKSDFRDKYKPYRSKHLKSQGMKASEVKDKLYYVGDEKKRGMLKAAGYKVTPEVWDKPVKKAPK